MTATRTPKALFQDLPLQNRTRRPGFDVVRPNGQSILGGEVTAFEQGGAQSRGIRHHHRFAMRRPEGNRDAAARNPAAHGGQPVGQHPIPIPRPNAYAKLGYAEGASPRAERAARTVLALPRFTGMTPDHVAVGASALHPALAA